MPLRAAFALPAQQAYSAAMREKEWYRKTPEEKIASFFLMLGYGLFMMVWVPIKWIGAGLWKLASDVAKGTYGRLVNWVAGILFIAIAGWIVTVVAH